MTFLGHVPQDELRGLYRLATTMVLPSLFEANSLPVFEAWLEGTPVACSNATALPEQVGDAAVLFNPTDAKSIADGVASIVTDPSLAATLRAKGSRRLKQFSIAGPDRSLVSSDLPQRSWPRPHQRGSPSASPIRNDPDRTGHWRPEFDGQGLSTHFRGQAGWQRAPVRSRLHRYVMDLVNGGLRQPLRARVRRVL